MIDIRVDPDSGAEVSDYLAGMMTRILAGVREGMQEAMTGLAQTVGSKFGGDPLHNRTGAMQQAEVSSARVWENSEVISGVVGGDPPDSPGPLDIWLEYGHEIPGRRKRHFEEENLRKNPLLRAAAEARRLLTLEGNDRRVPPHPFMYPSLDEYGPTILELIQRKVNDAIVD